MAPVEALKPRVGYTDLLRAPEDGRRYELYDGEVFVVPSPLPIHQLVVQNLVRLLEAYAAGHGGLALVSPLDIVFSEFDVLQPDVVFFRASRRHLVDLHAPTRSGPDLAVEVLSSSTAATDRGRKMQMLARYGVPEYWLVDPDSARLEILSLFEERYIVAETFSGTNIVHSPLLDGMTFEVDDIFRLP